MAIAAAERKKQKAASLLDILSPHAHKGLDADGSPLLLGRMMPDQPGPCMPAHSSILYRFVEVHRITVIEAVFTSFRYSISKDCQTLMFVATMIYGP